MENHQLAQGIIVRDSRPEDIDCLAENLRPADKAEVWKSNHKSPREALSEGMKNSSICLTVERYKKPIAMFGIVPVAILGRTATIWLLGSPEIKAMQVVFVKNSKMFINIMLKQYPRLINHVDIKNKQAIKWLKLCGAEIAEAAPYGVEQQLFKHFELRRN